MYAKGKTLEDTVSSSSSAQTMRGGRTQKQTQHCKPPITVRRGLTPIGLRQCANQRSNSNSALLARPNGISLAVHAGLQTANGAAYRVVASKRCHALGVATHDFAMALQDKKATFVRSTHHILGDAKTRNTAKELQALVLRAVLSQKLELTLQLVKIAQVALALNLNDCQAIAIDKQQIQFRRLALRAHQHIGNDLVEFELANHRFMQERVVEKLLGLIPFVAGHAAIELVKSVYITRGLVNRGRSGIDLALGVGVRLCQRQESLPKLGWKIIKSGAVHEGGLHKKRSGLNCMRLSHHDWALARRPSGDCLAGHDASQAANDMAWRAAA